MCSKRRQLGFGIVEGKDQAREHVDSIRTESMTLDAVMVTGIQCQATNAALEARLLHERTMEILNYLFEHLVPVCLYVLD